MLTKIRIGKEISTYLNRLKAVKRKCEISANEEDKEKAGLKLRDRFLLDLTFDHDD